MFTVYRCRLCEETYLGADKPSHCPFCGAHAEYIVTQKEWIDPERPELSAQSRTNLEATLGFEISNASFYQCAANRAKEAGDNWAYSMWKRLSRVESEHASIACKLLGISVPPLDNSPAICSTNYAENIESAKARETRAFTNYEKFATEATEPRIKEVFTLLVEIEKDHLALDEQLGKALKK